LKNQSRCIRLFIDKTGFAYGSVEGRVAIHYIESARDGSNFAFKCHRKGPANNNANSEIFTVNDISFHNFGTFATVGNDGNYTFWDKDSKQKLKSFKNCDLPITCCDFSPNGNFFAYSVGYDWSKGYQGYNVAQMKPHVFVHQVQPSGEINPKPAQQQRRN